MILFPFTPNRNCTFLLRCLDQSGVHLIVYSWKMCKSFAISSFFPCCICIVGQRRKAGGNRFRGVRRRECVHIISSRRSSISPDSAPPDGVYRILAGASLPVCVLIQTAMVSRSSVRRVEFFTKRLRDISLNFTPTSRLELFLVTVLCTVTGSNKRIWERKM